MSFTQMWSVLLSILYHCTSCRVTFVISANISSQSMVQWQGRQHECCMELGVSTTWPDTLNMCTCTLTYPQ